MAHRLRTIITSNEEDVRNQALETFGTSASAAEILAECNDLELFRHGFDNLYQRVRALFFLYALHRFYLPAKLDTTRVGKIPFATYERLLQRRFEEAVHLLLEEQKARGASDALCSALAAAYQQHGFQTLADQVRRSVRGLRGNQWMFRTGHPNDHPLRIRPELLSRPFPDAPFPILHERTPVRLDLSHSAWSDIFFLGMDYPEGARVVNLSIDLGVRGRDAMPAPPIDVFLRVIDEPVLRLVSVDLGASADLSQVGEVFDFAKDYLGLLKAAAIASGIIPPGLEGSEQSLAEVLARVVGPGLGLELVSRVNNIPKGSRLAVSTNLLAGLVSACMRATGQARALIGPLQEDERRLVAARAILGEWLGGSGGGWQDSGGAWPGMKLIEGTLAEEGDPEFGISRGRLLPRHTLLDQDPTYQAARQSIPESLVLVHGGLAQNVGPILEMVTEKYLLRCGPEWQARGQALQLLDEILAALRASDLRTLGHITTRNFREPIQTIVPNANNVFTESLIERVSGHFGKDFWGFCMLGGMSGGGMGFLVSPARRLEAQDFLKETMVALKCDLEFSLPFAMEPVVYDFSINQRGTWAELKSGADALMPAGYYVMEAPHWLRLDARVLAPARRGELGRFGAACRTNSQMAAALPRLFDRLFPRSRAEETGIVSLETLLRENYFDPAQHERIRNDLQSGRIGLAKNRLPATALVEDVHESDVVRADRGLDGKFAKLGQEALAAGAAAVLTLAGGVGSRWTQGAGVVKALHPFCKMAGKYRTFLEVHLAKSRRGCREFGKLHSHLVSTSYLTHGPIARYLEAMDGHGYPGDVILSPGRAVGQRLIPMTRDLRFAWEEVPQQLLDEQAQKLRESRHAAWLAWSEETGEGADYTDNLPGQCLHPVGHWYEIANLLRNGVLAELIAKRPSFRYLMVHNIDTLGADLDPALLGLHIHHGRCLTFEVIARRLEDRGGGLARVDGRPRLVEGLAMPRAEDEFLLSYYNSMTTWVDVNRLLSAFGLAPGDLLDNDKVASAVRKMANRLPTYITLKEVKKRWGHGQENVYPVSQWEKLWGDMTTMPEVDCGYVVVPRGRGQQLKDPSQLDGWLRDGSAHQTEALCFWE